MAQALYRKYRSKSFDEIIGQKNVVKALKTAVDNNLISHAYLFTGPRGVGKTSIARILAYAITESSYDSDELPLDIIEIDAASNRGIEEIRDLREKVMMAPVSAKRKVYIIDEVHMLTTHAFNALLKTLEEPPKHVVFILATTESHKVPETISSRTQRFNFSLASPEEVANHLRKISDSEKISITDEALMTIAKHSGGSMRDALSALDHVRHMSTNVTDEIVRSAIGAPDAELTNSIITAIINNDPQKIIEQINNNDSHAALISLSRDLVSAIINGIQNKTIQLPLHRLNLLLQNLLTVETSTQPRSQLLVALLTAIDDDVEYIKKPAISNKPVKQAIQEDVKEKSEEKPVIVDKIQPEISKSVDLPDGDVWAAVLQDVRATYNTLYSILRMVDYEHKDNTVFLRCKFDFHRKRLSEAKNKSIIANSIAKYLGNDIEISILTMDKKENVEKSDNVDDSDINAIRMVFNGAEPLE